MIDAKALKEQIDESGMTIVAFCRKSGMTKQTFYKKIKEPEKFTIKEVDGMVAALRLKAADKRRIFLA